VIQDKTTAGLPPHLRTASPVKVNVVSQNSPALRQAQLDDPDILAILHFRNHQSWPDNCSKEQQQRLAALEPAFYQDDQGVAWLQTQQQTALFLPALFRAGLLCQTVKQNPTANSPELLQLVQARGYAWPGMLTDVTQHKHQCEKCATSQIQPVYHNEQVALEIYGPFPSYTPEKYLMAMMDHNTGIVEFVPLENKNASTMALHIFTNWISKFGVPKLITTYFPEDFNSDVAEAIRPFVSGQTLCFTTVQTPAMPENLYQAVNAIIKDAEQS